MSDEPVAPSIKKEIKAVLFASGKPLDLDFISELVKEKKHVVKKMIVELQHDLDQSEDSLMIVEDQFGYKMTTRERYLNLVRQIVPETELSKTVLETLAVIIWKQPVLQSEVIRIRTNKAYDHIAQLEDAGFIQKTKHGRTYLIKGTEKLYNYFDVPNENAMKNYFKEFKDVDPEKRRMKQVGNLEVFEMEKQKQTSPMVFVNPEEGHIGKLEIYDENADVEQPAQLVQATQPEHPEPEEKSTDDGQEEESAPEEKEEQTSEIFDSDEIEQEAEKRAEQIAGIASTEKDAEDEDEDESEESSEEKPEEKKETEEEDERELAPPLEHMVDEDETETKDEDKT